MFLDWKAQYWKNVYFSQFNYRLDAIESKFQPVFLAKCGKCKWKEKG